MEIEIREYRDEDELEWMEVHAKILTISHSWNYCIQERPAYEGHESTRLVMIADGKIIGLTDTIYDNEAGEVCMLDTSRGGYVTEFGRLPGNEGRGLGIKLIDATIEDARKKGITRLEYWSQDRNAQRSYMKLGLKEISRPYRFRMKAPQPVTDTMLNSGIAIECIYGVCTPEGWHQIKKDQRILQDHPLEPHLCIGYEIPDFDNPYELS
ncbi:MAG: GNAT family N-acetyltransferase [Candidatus Hydrogenedentota bacterium]